MRKHLLVLAACFMAGSVIGVAGPVMPIVLNNSTGDVSWTTETLSNVSGSPLNVMTLGSDNCSSNCVLSSVITPLPMFKVSWSIQALNPNNATLVSQLYTYSYTPDVVHPTDFDGTGAVTDPTTLGSEELILNDSLDGGSDSATASVNLTSLAQGGQQFGMTISGSVVLAAGGVSFFGNSTDSAMFQGLLGKLGVMFSGAPNPSLPDPLASETNLVFTDPGTLLVTNCMSSGSPSACILSADPTGTFSSLTIGTAAPSGVPEPGTLGLFGCGLAVLMVVRSKLDSSRRRR